MVEPPIQDPGLNAEFQAELQAALAQPYDITDEAAHDVTPVPGDIPEGSSDAMPGVRLPLSW